MLIRLRDKVGLRKILQTLVQRRTPENGYSKSGSRSELSRNRISRVVSLSAVPLSLLHWRQREVFDRHIPAPVFNRKIESVLPLGQGDFNRLGLLP